MFLEIETDRLLIRPLAMSDIGFIFDLLNSEGWLQFIGDRNVRNTMDAAQYIQKILENKKYFYSVFELKDTHEPVGIVTFLYRVNQQFPDIGFAMLPKYAKKGYALEATKKYLEEVARANTVSKIIALTLPENSNSIRLIERLGLTYENTFNDQSEILFLYSLKLNDLV